jgi:histidinol-phosphate/aromatic aminotransferase/cobyric acid decarboxylase-like protein
MAVVRDFTAEQAAIAHQVAKLKDEAGSHSPSLLTLREQLPDLDVTVDACFISNPYATKLFIDHLQRELIDTGVIRDVLEFYPSQNSVIAALLAQHLGVGAERLFVGNGAIEIIQAVIHNFAKRRILVNLPTFSAYYEFAQGRVDVVFNTLTKATDFRIDVDAYLAKVRESDPDLVVLINPNNPDGSYLPYEDLQRIIEELPPEITVVVDESFIHFAFEDMNLDIRSVIDQCPAHPNLIVVKSMSKDFGIAGIRAGYAVMDPARIAGLLANGYLWNSNGLAEYFFRLYCRDDFVDHYDTVRKQYILETQLFYRQLEKVPGIRVYPSMANFALIEILGGVSADDVTQHMLIRHGVYVRTCSDKIGLDGEYLRVASRGLRDNQRIIDALNEVLGEG